MLELFNPLQNLIDELQTCQRSDGAIEVTKVNQAESIFTKILPIARQVFKALGHKDLGVAFVSDVQTWSEQGLQLPPAFDLTRDTFQPPGEGESTFFIGPMILANGPEPRGHYFEYFFGTRFEPDYLKPIYKSYPHPKNKCQSLKLEHASRRLIEGNCIVFFPENIKTCTSVQKQKFAMFFFNKFHVIYHQQTLAIVEKLLVPGHGLFNTGGWLSARLSSSACYEARCLWGYLHDYFHHQSPRPFDAHISLKCNWHIGLLEELKVDCMSALLCLDDEIPYGKEVFEFILLERLFRYPLQVDMVRNFDAGSGVLLFEKLLSSKGITIRESKLAFHHDAVVAGLRELVRDIEALDHLPDPDLYKIKAREFVHKYLPVSENIADRFAVPSGYQQVLSVGMCERLKRVHTYGN